MRAAKWLKQSPRADTLHCGTEDRAMDVRGRLTGRRVQP